MFTAANILQNPVAGTSHLAPRSMIIQGLIARASNANVRFVGCKIRDSKTLTVSMQLGSESVPDLFYDIMFDFINYRIETKDKTINGISIAGTELKVFSNSPEFVFNYAYTFNRNGYLIERYKHLLGNFPLSVPAKVKNPDEYPGFSTSLFSCMYWLKQNNFFGNFAYSRFLNDVEARPKSYDNVDRITINYRKATRRVKTIHKSK